MENGKHDRVSAVLGDVLGVLAKIKDFDENDVFFVFRVTRTNLLRNL